MQDDWWTKDPSQSLLPFFGACANDNCFDRRFEHDEMQLSHAFISELVTLEVSGVHVAIVATLRRKDGIHFFASAELWGVGGRHPIEHVCPRQFFLYVDQVSNETHPQGRLHDQISVVLLKPSALCERFGFGARDLEQ